MRAMIFASIMCFMLLAGSGTLSAATIIKFAVSTNPNAPLTIASEEFKKFVEEKSGGKYQVDLFIGASYGGADTVFQAIQFDTLQIALETTSNLSQFCPELSIFDMPYLLPSYSAVEKVINGEIGSKILGYLKKKHVQPIGLCFVGNRYLISRDKIDSIDQFKNLKHRTTASRSHIESIRSLGLNPVPVAATELLTSMQQGVVDSADLEINWHLSARSCDVNKYIFDIGHIANFYVLYTNQDWFNGLKGEDKAIFDEAFKNFIANGNKYALEGVQKSLDTLINKEGCVFTKITPEEKEKLIQKSRAAYDVLPDNLKKLALEVAESVKN